MPCQEGAEEFLPLVVASGGVETFNAPIVAVNALTVYGTPCGKITVNPNALQQHIFEAPRCALCYALYNRNISKTRAMGNNFVRANWSHPMDNLQDIENRYNQYVDHVNQRGDNRASAANVHAFQGVPWQMVDHPKPSQLLYVPHPQEIENMNRYNNRMLIYFHGLQGMRVRHNPMTMTPIRDEKGYFSTTPDNTLLGHQRGPAVPLRMAANDWRCNRVTNHRGNHLQGHVVHTMPGGYVPPPPPQPLPQIFLMRVGQVNPQEEEDDEGF